MNLETYAFIYIDYFSAIFSCFDPNLFLVSGCVYVIVHDMVLHRL